MDTPGNCGAAAVAAAGAHVVQGGESLFTISKMYGTTVQKILASNDLGQDKRIKIGQTLIIPEGAAKAAPAEAVVNTKLTCEVKSGDTLSGIARRYGLSVEDLVKENQLSPDDALFVGDKLRVSITPPEPVKVVQLPVASVPNPPPTSVDSVVPNPAPQKVLTARLQAAQVELEKIPSLVTGWSQAVTTTMQANVPSSIPPNVAAGAGWAGLGLGVMVVTGLATRALGFGARAEPPPRQPQRVLPLKLGPDGQPVGSKEEPVRKQSGMRFLSDSLDKLVMNTESAAEDLMKKSSELREKKMENGTSSVNAPLNSNHLNGTGADSTINGRSADIHVKDEGTPTDAGAGNGVPIRSSPEEWYTKYTKDPVAKEPVAEEPMAEEPPAEEPLVEGPMAEEPLAEPVVEEPVAELAVAEQLGEPVPELVAEPAAEPVVDAAEQVVEPEVEPDSSPETELKPEAVAMQASLEQVAEQVVERLVGQATDEQLEVLLAEQSEPASAASTEVPGEAGDTASSGAAAWMEIVAEVPAVDTLVTRLSTLEDQAEFDKEVAAGAKRDVLNEQTSSDAELGAQHEALSLLENAADEIRDQLAQVEEQMGGAREANRPLQQAAAQAEQAHADLSEQLEQAHSEEAALTAVAAEEEEKYLESKQNATTAQLDAEEAQAAAAAAETELAESPGAIRVALQEANMAVEASIQVREDVRKELSELAVRSVEASEAAARISTEGAAARRDAQQRAGELEEVEVLLAVAKESHETAEASVASLRAAAEAMSKAAELNPSQAALAKATLEAVTPAELEMRNWSLAMEQREEEAVGCRAAEAATAAAARNAEKKAQKAETEVELLNGQLEQTQWKSEDATAAVEEAKLALQRTERDGAARMAAAEKLVKLTADEAPAKVEAAVLAAATLENATLTRAASREAAAAAVAATMELVPQLAVAKELAERQRGEAEAALAEALAPLTQRTAELETILQVADHKVELAHQGVARSEKSADESMKMAMANAAVAEDRALDSWQNAVVHLSEVELEESELNVEIMEIRAEIMSKIAAHEALSEAAVALQRAQATGDSIATMEAAQQVTHASDAITSALGSTLEQWRQESAGGPPDVPAGEAPEAAAPEAAPEPLRRMAPRYEFEHVGNSVGLLAPAGKRLGSKALLVYIPGLDGTGQGIRRQLEALLAEGFDVRSVCIPHGNRSDWAALAAGALPLIQDAVSEIRHAMEAAGATTERDAEEVHVTLVAESFFAPLGLTLAAEAPTLITSLVLINPSTRYRDNSPNLAAAAELASGLGLLEIIPTAVYEAAQDIVQALLVRSNSMNQAIAAQQLE
eukprot:gene1004-1528_t